MRNTLRWAPFAGLWVVWVLGLWVVPAWASHEAFGVYEDWKGSHTIRSDRWTALEVGQAQEVALQIRGHQLVMRQRRESATTSAGFVFGRYQLILSNPASIDQIEADIKIRSLEVSGCATNPTQPSRVIVAIFLNIFNDGSSPAPGNMTGDHLASISVFRESSSTDPEGVLRVNAAVLRCIDATCSNAFSIPNGVVDLPEMVLVGERFTLRLVWDAPENRVLVGVGSNLDAAIVYPRAINVQDPGGPFADIRTQLLAANCTVGPTVTDAKVKVKEVRTNASAIIP